MVRAASELAERGIRRIPHCEKAHIYAGFIQVLSGKPADDAIAFHEDENDVDDSQEALALPAPVVAIEDIEDDDALEVMLEELLAQSESECLAGDEPDSVEPPPAVGESASVAPSPAKRAKTIQVCGNLPARGQ